jgi:hypothetical protein
MCRRYLLYRHDYGVYLGSFLGLGFWSKIDPVGQSEAPTFAKPRDITSYVSTWDRVPDYYFAVPVEISNDNGEYYATLKEIETAGLERWEVLR